MYLDKCEVLVLVCSGHIEMFVPATMSWKRIGMESAVVTEKTDLILFYISAKVMCVGK